MIDVSRSNEIDMNGKFYSSERKLFDEHPIYVDLFSTYLTEKKTCNRTKTRRLHLSKQRFL